MDKSDIYSEKGPEPIVQPAYDEPRGRFSLRVKQSASSFAPGAAGSNADFDPVPPSRRTWGPLSFVAYWMADAWAISNFEVGSSMVSVGMGWKMALGITVLGNSIMALVITANGRLGSTLHVPFPVLARMSFGYYFAYFAVVSRAVLAIFWLGIQTTTGGQCINALVNAMAPSFRNHPNSLPASADITSAGMICYFVYFCLQIPFLCIPYHRIQWFFAAKAVIAPTVFFAVFASTLHKSGGSISGVSSSTTLTGAALAWAFLGNLNSVLGNYATLGLNISDFSRYAKKYNSQDIQVIVIPFIFTIVGMLGIFTAAASTIAYPELSMGKAIWNPLVIVNSWSAAGSSGGRAAAAFASLGLLVVTIGINISANSISAANDLVALAPKYINLRRGQILAAFIGGWAFVPWVVLASASKFLSFMAGYTIFLGPLTGILMCDYYLVKQKKVSVPAMYNFESIYRYGSGANWRAAVGFLCGAIPPLPGLINYIEPTITINEGAQHIFSLGYLYSFLSAAVVYYTLSHFFPDHTSELPAVETGEDRIVAGDQKNYEA